MSYSKKKLPYQIFVGMNCQNKEYPSKYLGSCQVPKQYLKTVSSMIFHFYCSMNFKMPQDYLVITLSGKGQIA